MLVRVLGAVDVVSDDRAVDIGSPTQRTLLAVLAARAPTAVTTDLLLDAVWGDTPPRTATSSLRTYVSRLRTHLGDRLASAPGGYSLAVTAEELDALRFEQLVELARTLDGADALACLEEALALWRGPCFGDLTDHEALRGARARLEELRTAAAEARVRTMLAIGRTPEAVAAAESLVAEHPLREGPWVLLVDGLVGAGRAPEALRAYRRAAAALAEAGLEPSTDLRRAESNALADPRPVVNERPALRLPASTFVGRARDRRALAEMLAERRLVTVVGPGGVGKTRLALTVANDLVARFRWGARLVRLSPVEDGFRVADAIAGDLGLAVDADGPRDALARAGQLDVLVLLDNCEHVIDEAADAATLLVQGGAGIRVLATSREPLGVDGEQLWPLDPLTVDGPEAVELFLDRARGSRPDFTIGRDELALVRDVVELLDGLPLAIEMAAAALRAMPLAELHRRLHDTLEPPQLSRRTTEQRHRSLRSLVAWSTRRLADEERAVLRSLTTFRGAFAAEDVAEATALDDAFDVLCRLSEQSLLTTVASAGAARFGMLRTIRLAVLEELGAPDDAMLRRHAEWVTGRVEEADELLRTPDERRGHDAITRQLGDARAAITWALSNDPSIAVRLGGALMLFGQSRARDEVLGWAEEVVAAVDPLPAGDSSARCLAAAAQRAVNVGRLDDARRLAGAATAHGSSGAVRALAYELLSDIELFTGDLERARRLAGHSLDAARTDDDPHALVIGVVNLALAHAYDTDATPPVGPDDVPRHLRLAPSDRAWLHYLAGEVQMDRDPVVALAALDAAIDLADSVGNGYISSVARVSAASLRSRIGDPVVAVEPFVELVQQLLGRGNRTHLLTALRNMVVLLQRLDLPEDTAELLGAVDDDEATASFGEERERLLGARAWVTDRLGSPETAHRVSRGRQRDLDAAARVAIGAVSRA